MIHSSFVNAAFVGLLSTLSAPSEPNPQEIGQPGAEQLGDKDGCSGKDGCGGKDGCSGKKDEKKKSLD